MCFNEWCFVLKNNGHGLELMHFHLPLLAIVLEQAAFTTKPEGRTGEKLLTPGAESFSSQMRAFPAADKRCERLGLELCADHGVTYRASKRTTMSQLLDNELCVCTRRWCAKCMQERAN